jgi:hypothetical protein
MAISINWNTYVISIPKADLSLVGGTLYELDTDLFRLILKGLEVTDNGIVELRTHLHNTEVTIAGVTYARALSLINGYSITFEDGQYSVRLVGSNNDFFDIENGKLNQNQVQVIPTNSAGLIVNTVISGSGVTEQDKLDIADRVWDESIEDHQAHGTAGMSPLLAPYMGQYGAGVWVWDGAANTNTVTGTDGTENQPVSTIAAAETIATALGIQRIYFMDGSQITLDQNNIRNWDYIGNGAPTSNQIDLDTNKVDNSHFINLRLTGAQGNGTDRANFVNCVLIAMTNLHPYADHCALAGDITLTSGDDHVFADCYSAVAGNGTPSITFGNPSAASVIFRRYSGGIEVQNMSANHTMSIETDGQLIVNANCSGGSISIRGNATIIDNSGGAVTLSQDAALSRSVLVDEVWDEATVDHQTPGTTGKALTDAGAAGNPWDTPVGTPVPGTYGYYMTKKLLTFAKWIGLR